jgi:hypothetical protein
MNQKSNNNKKKIQTLAQYIDKLQQQQLPFDSNKEHLRHLLDYTNLDELKKNLSINQEICLECAKAVQDVATSWDHRRDLVTDNASWNNTMTATTAATKCSYTAIHQPTVRMAPAKKPP